MSYIIELFIFSLLVFIDHRFVRAFNETCGSDMPACSDPLKCINGYCLCSNIGKTKDEKNPLSFWSGYQCITCPIQFITSGTKCYSLIYGKDNQVNWDRARQLCQERSGDLLVIRSEEEYQFMSTFVRINVNNDEMFSRTPRNGTTFGSVWIGARLADWRGDGIYNLVSHGLPLTKRTKYWCPQTSPLQQEPNYVGLKTTGERQACIGFAVFKDGMVCMHDWFCSWNTHTFCEIHPPTPPTTSNETDLLPDALEEKSSKMWLYVGIGGVVLIILIISIGAFYFMCSKKKTAGRARSFDSGESGMSQNSLY